MGLGLIAAGICLYVLMGRYLREAREVTGIVVEVLHESATPNGRRHPVVRFTTGEGKEVVVRYQAHHNVKPGEPLQLVYEPQKPEEAEIGTLERTRHQRLALTALCVLLGLGVCYGGFRIAPRDRASRGASSDH